MNRKREVIIAVSTYTLAAVIALVAILILTGCGKESAGDSGCVGTVAKTYTEYKAEPSGSALLPAGSTRYYIAVEKTDGTFCSKRLDKNEWLGIKEGDSYGV